MSTSPRLRRRIFGTDVDSPPSLLGSYENKKIQRPKWLRTYRRFSPPQRSLALSTSLLSLCAFSVLLLASNTSDGHYGRSMTPLQMTPELPLTLAFVHEHRVVSPWTSLLPYADYQAALQAREQEFAQHEADDRPSDGRVVGLRDLERRTGHTDYVLDLEHEVHYRKQLEAMDVYPDGLPHALQDDFDYAETHPGCRRTSFRSKFFVNCNRFHEQTLDRAEHDNLQDWHVDYMGRGVFRVAWRFRNMNQPDEQFIFKSLKLQYDLPFDLSYARQIHNEAIILEHLTASPRIIDIYGHCGMSVFAEVMDHMVSDDVVPWLEHHHYQGYMLQSELDEWQKEDVHPLNDLTDEQRLDMALVMAESLADIHGFEGGVILHGDAHTDQWLRAKDGTIKLNDFNNAEILSYDPHKMDYCKEYRCFGGTYRPPEEFRCVNANEKVDTYVVGQVIYSLMTGLYPFYQYVNLDDNDVEMKIIEERERPFVDPRYRGRSKILDKMIEVMEQCWEWDPDRRVSVFEVVRQLRQLKESIHKS